MPTHCDPEVRESGLAKAERLLAEHLQARRKGDPQKVDIAARRCGCFKQGRIT
jgi:hypothetical protein